MCSGAVVVSLIRTQHMTQMPLAEYNHMIEALTSDRADQTFGIAVLPRRARRCRSVANAHGSNTPGKCFSIDTVPITNEISRHRIPAAGLADLSSYPFGRRMGRDAKPENSSTAMPRTSNPYNSRNEIVGTTQ